MSFPVRPERTTCRSYLVFGVTIPSSRGRLGHRAIQRSSVPFGGFVGRKQLEPANKDMEGSVGVETAPI